MGVVADTSILVAAERGKFDLSRFFLSAAPDSVFISSVTASELLLGCHLSSGSTDHPRRLAVTEGILATVPILEFGLAESRQHAVLLAALRRRGATIGAHDAMIAATAQAGGHAVATLDVGDFSRVPGLKLVEIGEFVRA